jgi:hypothetical protein
MKVLQILLGIIFTIMAIVIFHLWSEQEYFCSNMVDAMQLSIAGTEYHTLKSVIPDDFEEIPKKYSSDFRERDKVIKEFLSALGYWSEPEHKTLNFKFKNKMIWVLIIASSDRYGKIQPKVFVIYKQGEYFKMRDVFLNYSKKTYEVKL